MGEEVTRVLKKSGVNLNGMIFSKEVLADAVKRFNEKGPRDLYGELGQPTRSGTYVDTSRTCCRTKNLRLDEDGNIIGEVELITGTEVGDLCKKMFENDLATMGMRSLGKINEDGQVTWVEIVTFDVIAKDGGPIEAFRG